MKHLVCLVFTLSLACSHTPTQSPAPTAGKASTLGVSDLGKWGETESVMAYRNFFVSESPDWAALTEFKNRGGKFVIDFRSKKEVAESQQKELAQKLGLKYANLPVNRGELPSDKVQKLLASELKSIGNEPAYLFCASGNRASAGLVLHLNKSEKLDAKTALSLAQELGLTNEDLVSRLKAKLK